MNLQGTIIAVLPTRSGTSANGKAWACASYVLEIPGTFTRHMAFEVFGEDKINGFDIKVGEQLSVDFEIDAHQWQDKWFNSIRAWNVTRVNAPQTQVIAPQPTVTAAPQQPADTSCELPF